MNFIAYICYLTENCRTELVSGMLSFFGRVGTIRHRYCPLPLLPRFNFRNIFLCVVGELIWQAVCIRSTVFGSDNINQSWLNMHFTFDWIGFYLAARPWRSARKSDYRCNSGVQIIVFYTWPLMGKRKLPKYK